MYYALKNQIKVWGYLNTLRIYIRIFLRKHYITTNTEDIISTLVGKKYFAVWNLDLASGFLHMVFHSESQ